MKTQDTMNKELCYSADQEDYSYDNVHDAAEEFWNSALPDVGSICTLWVGEKEEYTASQFLPDIADALLEKAYDDAGEYADRWHFTADQQKELQILVADTVDLWARANGKQPNFYRVRNSREIQIRFINEDGECEIVDEPNNPPHMHQNENAQ